ncbi:MAG: NUDIX domain-containing protein [Treponema sp.]|nr:NUDIX domain-containing protein [Treponema sp.]
MDKNSVAGIVYKNGKVLIAHRLPVGQMGNRWEFPGGKVENSEDFTITLKREFLEEFGVEVKIGKHITESFFYHNDKKIGLHAFEVFIKDNSNDFILTEHSEIKWVTFDEIPKLCFVDSDMKIYDSVKKYFEG